MERKGRKNMNETLTFRDLGLSEAMLKALEKKGYGYPTTIQAQAIPEFMRFNIVESEVRNVI